MNLTNTRLLAGLLSLVLFMSACAGSTALPSTESSQESSQESTAEVDSASSTDDGITRFPGHEGQVLVSGLIPELADLPVPDVAAFHTGGAFDANQDPRETATQRVDFLLEPAEVAAFYFDALAAQGYTAVANNQPGSVEQLAELVEAGAESFTLDFDGPDGIPLRLIIDPGNTGGNTTMNINRFRSGTR